MEDIVNFVFDLGIIIVIHQCSNSFTDKYPINYFKKVIENLNNHFSTKNRKSHLEALEMAMALHAVKTNQAMAIDHQLSSSRAKLVA